MYIPAHFLESRPEILQELIAAHPLGTLVTLTSTGIEANHIPFEIEAATTEAAPHGTLRAHVARANPVWKDFSRDTEALVIFQGPQTYVTPTWYVETKPATGKVVPTWNYCVVHAHGPVQVKDDRAWLRGQLERLVQRHESTQPAPWHLSDAPPNFIEQQISAIVGIEIPITRIVGKWKVSQNRSEADRAGIVAGLSADHQAASQAMAELVRARLRT